MSTRFVLHKTKDDDQRQKNIQSAMSKIAQRREFELNKMLSSLDIETQINFIEKWVIPPEWEECSKCTGNGYAINETSIDACPRCNWAGVIDTRENN